MVDMTIDLLPPDIKTDIFSRLPLDSIIQYRLLCKTWRTLIDELFHDPSFMGKHTHQLLSSPASYSTSFLARENFYNLCSQSHIGDDHNEDHWSIVGSCNGLVCLVTKSKSLQDHYIYICNPFTREYVNLLPQSNQCGEKLWWHCMSPQVFATGFGYHPCTKEYKFVRIIYDPYQVSGKMMYVSTYTLGSCRWSMKDGGVLLRRLWFCSKRTTPVVCLHLNGVLYWSISPDGNILSFELDTEEFRFVPAPPAQESLESTVDGLGVLDGCFCVIRTQIMDGSKDIWVRNKEECEEEIYTWTKKIRIKPAKGYHQIERAITPFVLYENILSNYFYMKFDSYDSNTRSLIHLIDKYTIDFQIVDNRCEILPYVSRCEMIPYMMSLVSLKALGENSHFAVKRERKSQSKRNQEEEIAI